MPGATVCESDMSVFRGDLSISTGSVVHPSATIIAKSGPIILGENCLVEEFATIIYDLGDDDENMNEENTTNNEKQRTLIIGPNNVFEVGCTVRAIQIGEGNVFECKSKVSERSRISNHCVIGAGCYLDESSLLPEKTVIFGNNPCDRRESLEKPGVIFFSMGYYKFPLNINFLFLFSNRHKNCS